MTTDSTLNQEEKPTRETRNPLRRSVAAPYPIKRRNKDEIEKQVQALRKKMLSLGFIKRAKEELVELAHDASVPYRQQLAANELAVWHLNQATQDDARKALEYLSIVSRNTSDPTPLRKARILVAEAYHLLGDKDKARHTLYKALKQSAHADTFLALSNLETEEPDKEKLINQALHLKNLSEIRFSDNETDLLYDRLSAIVPAWKSESMRNAPLISVIMPAYNSEKTIHGVDPFSWTPDYLGNARNPRCRNEDYTRRSSGTKWWSWFVPGVPRKHWPKSLNPQPRPSAIGWSRPIAMKAVGPMV